MEENMQLLAPNGWEASPYYAFFHPTPEQSYQANLLFCEHTNRIFKKKETIPTFEEYMQDYEEDNLPVKPEAELYELIGRLVYMLCEYNNIKDPSGCIIALEDGRDGGEFIAQLLNMHYPLDEKEFVDSDVYSAICLEDYIDPYPVWLLFFQRMKAHHYDMFIEAENASSADILQAYREVYGKQPLYKN